MCALSDVVVAGDLTKRYGQFEAVRGISFAIRAGECFGFLGVNGAGKTTTMKMIYCRIARTSGTLDVLGLDAATHAQAIKQRIGVVAQENALDPELTALENLLLYASFFGISGRRARAKAAELLESLSLTGKERARLTELSGGMKRRLVIARALVNDPEMLVLDEPTTGLDPQARLLVWEKLTRYRDSGLTLLLTTHYMEEAERLCNRIAVIDEGRILAEGSPQELIRRFAGDDVLEIIGTQSELPALDQLDGLVMRREQHGDILYLYNSDNRTLLHRLAELGYEPPRHVARRATLEDVFLNITGRELVE
ncbi:MAG TPA: ABC transporter ATP-binding protein [Candidatus Eremiobacteraceae bacterium]|nr:ABC transporter ATP-binding protein [Candidatus Eremiobacteraceae bacterium]